jgi:hypothetical protein
LLGENTNGREFIAGRKPSGGSEMLHLIYNLDVNWNAVGGGDVELHDEFWLMPL